MKSEPEPPPVRDDATQSALHLFVVLMRCTNSITEQMRQEMARYDLSASEFAVLELLYHKGPTALGAIAERVLLTSGSMTYVIDQLEKQGLVMRVACPTDRRRMLADLTESGRAKIAALFPGHAERIRQIMSALSPPEQEQAARLLKQLGLAQERERFQVSGVRGQESSS